jgi:hypothetical protein
MKLIEDLSKDSETVTISSFLIKSFYLATDELRKEDSKF